MVGVGGEHGWRGGGRGRDGAGDVGDGGGEQVVVGGGGQRWVVAVASKKRFNEQVH